MGGDSFPRSWVQIPALYTGWTFSHFFAVRIVMLGGSPGLVFMGDDSCSEGRGFESQHCIPDVRFSHLFVVRIVKFV